MDHINSQTCGHSQISVVHINWNTSVVYLMANNCLTGTICCNLHFYVMVVEQWILFMWRGSRDCINLDFYVFFLPLSISVCWSVPTAYQLISSFVSLWSTMRRSILDRFNNKTSSNILGVKGLIAPNQNRLPWKLCAPNPNPSSALFARPT